MICFCVPIGCYLIYTVPLSAFLCASMRTSVEAAWLFARTHAERACACVGAWNMGACVARMHRLLSGLACAYSNGQRCRAGCWPRAPHLSFSRSLAHSLTHSRTHARTVPFPPPPPPPSPPPPHPPPRPTPPTLSPLHQIVTKSSYVRFS